MQTERPEKLIDPVCGMTVNVATAEAAGLLLEHEGRTWAFCREGCKRAFVESPAEYIAQAEVATQPRGATRRPCPSSTRACAAGTRAARAACPTPTPRSRPSSTPSERRLHSRRSTLGSARSPRRPKSPSAAH